VKRVVDYPRIYDSGRLAALPSDEYRAEYVWLLGIAGPNGSFEWCERRLWAATYAPIRDKTVEDLSRYLQAFRDAGLLLKWEQDGKTWGYFVGSEKPGRLPRESWRQRFAQTGGMAPAPPPEILSVVSVSNSRDQRDELTADLCTGRVNGVPLSESLSESLSEVKSAAYHTKDDRQSHERFDGSEWALKTFKAYPTWGDPDALVAPPRLADAYMQTIEAEAPSRGGLLEAAGWFLEVTEEFARQSADKEPKFIMQLEKFLRQGYAEVKLPRKANKYVPSESDEECEKRLREENRDRRRAAREVAATV
jgi:hypothetical protein